MVWLLALGFGTFGQAAAPVRPPSPTVTTPTTTPGSSSGPPGHLPLHSTSSPRAEDRTSPDSPFDLLRQHQALGKIKYLPDDRSAALTARPSFSRSHDQQALYHLPDMKVNNWTEASASIASITTGSSGTVIFSANFNCSDYTKMITITGSVTVHGSGAVCDANEAGSFFHVNQGAVFRLASMTLRKGFRKVRRHMKPAFA